MSTTYTLTQRTILAIDDTPSIRTFLRICLQAQGAQFYEAGNAKEGVDMCSSIKPDLVVLDLGLPDRDGLDILPELKQSVDGRTPAVIILSVRKEQKTKDRAMALGADAYLSKPFMMDELLEVIDEHLAS